MWEREPIHSSINQAAASYIPSDRRHALASGYHLPNRDEGAVLFADIAGFTLLTRALVQTLGVQRGVEELTHQLNQVFTALIEEVDRYQGSVVMFSGDAITCWFPQDTGLRATACGLAMQQAMQSFFLVDIVPGVTITLTMKVAITSGPIRRFLVGDPQIQYFDVLAGSTLERMAALEQQTSRGDVVLDVATARRLGTAVQVTYWLPGPDNEPLAGVVYRVHIPAIPDMSETQGASLKVLALEEDQLRSWLPPPLYERLQEGQDEFLVDLRLGVVLFLRFSGIDYDNDDAAGEKLDAYVRWVQQTLAQYESFIVQVTIGDKGSYLCAAFGAPLAHDDDPQRALEAAVELHEPPLHLSYIGDVQIGICRGYVRAGTYGGPTRHTYGLFGDDVNLAARLMEQAAPGEILVSPRMARLTERYYQFQSFGAVSLKGRSDPIHAFMLVGRRAVPLSGLTTRFACEHMLYGIRAYPTLVPCVGRECELETLTTSLDDLLDGNGHVLLIEGEAGIGKSRLVCELVRMASKRGLRTLLGAASQVHQQTAYYAWQTIFSAYFNLHNLSDLQERQRWVRTQVNVLAPHLVERLPLLNELLHLSFPETPLIAGMDASLRNQSLTALLIEIVRRASINQPLVLVLEDGHWLDALSWELTLQMTRILFDVDLDSRFGSLPVLLVIVTRSLDGAILRPEPALLTKLPITRRMVLTEISPDALMSVAASYLGLSAEELPEEIATLVRARSGGNPFFAEELVAMLCDSALLRMTVVNGVLGYQIHSDVSRLAQTLPDTIQGVVLSRLDCLPIEAQLVLKVASVIGRAFSYPVLRDAVQSYAGLSERMLRIQLDELLYLNIVVVATREPEITYMFRHVIIQEVIYNTLLFSQRRTIHRLIAEWYECTCKELDVSEAHLPEEETHVAPFIPQSTLASYYPLLVYHYHHAEDAELECYYARLAGEKAAAQFANTDAVTYLSRALDLTPDDAIVERYALLLAREQVYDLQGERDAQQHDLVLLQGLAEALNDNLYRAEVALRQAHYAGAIGDYRAARIAAQDAINLADRIESSKSRELVAGAHWQQGQILYRKAEYAEATRHLKIALSLARAGRLSGIEANSLRDLGSVADMQGDYDVARSYYTQALRLYHIIHNRRGESATFLALGRIAYQRNDYDTASHLYNEALRLARLVGDQHSEGLALGYLGDIAVDQGNYPAAQRHSMQALHLVRAIGNREGEIHVLGSLGYMSFALGDVKRACDYTEQVLSLACEIGNRERECWARETLGMIMLHMGKYALARDYSQQARQLACAIGARRRQGFALTVQGHALMQLGNLDAAADAYQQALVLRRALSEADLATEAMAGLATIALLQGEQTRAWEYADKIVLYLATSSLDGASDPFQVYLLCYRILKATADPRAGEVLTRAYTALQERAAMINDTAMRQSFLQNIGAHRELVAAWTVLTESERSWQPAEAMCQ